MLRQTQKRQLRQPGLPRAKQKGNLRLGKHLKTSENNKMNDKQEAKFGVF